MPQHSNTARLLMKWNWAIVAPRVLTSDFLVVAKKQHPTLYLTLSAVDKLHSSSQRNSTKDKPNIGTDKCHAHWKRLIFAWTATKNSPFQSTQLWNVSSLHSLFSQHQYKIAWSEYGASMSCVLQYAILLPSHCYILFIIFRSHAKFICQIKPKI